ncbi:MAG: flavin-containing monooxygenase, partial [Actinomadura sp.]
TATTRFLIMATGALSAPRVPDFPGLDGFGGRWHHTANWPAEPIDFTGRRVAVIGTGSSGVQVIPQIAARAERLYVMQRTAGFVVPAYNRDLTADEVRAVKDDYPAYRDRARNTFLGVHGLPAGPSALAVPPEERTAVYEKAWRAGGPILGTYGDLLVDQAANDTLADFLRSKIAELVKDEETARLLIPRGFPVGAKRLVIGTEYYPTFNLGTVELVDVRSAPIEEVTATGLRTAAAEYEVDDIVFATGFDALTGPLLAIDIRGTGGRALADAWAAGPATYLGLAVSGFPNLFPIAGPGTTAALSNVPRTTELNVEWVTELIRHMREHGHTTAEADPGEQRTWTAHVNEVADRTLFPRADSWYVGANVPGKPRVFMPYAGGLPEYRRICGEVAADGYRGFRFTP